MAINVAGTNALGDYLVSQITNTRTLIDGATADASSSPFGAALAAETATPQQPLSTTALHAQVSADNLANTQMLVGQSGTSDAETLATIPGESSLEAAQLASQFSTATTLLGSNAIGTNTNTTA